MVDANENMMAVVGLGLFVIILMVVCGGWWVYPFKWVTDFLWWSCG